MSPGILQQAGAQADAPASLYLNRFRAGLWTQRNPLRDPSTVGGERYYGGGTDALLDGLNVEISNRLTLARACGSTKFFTSGTTTGVPQSFYSFKQFSGNSETIYPMVDTSTQVGYINPTTSSYVAITGKGNNAGPAFFVGVNGILYWGDGVEQQVWQPIGNVLANWGISSADNEVGGGVVGGTCGHGANGTGGGSAWTNPNNIATPLSTASVVLGAGGSSQQLLATQFAFSGAAATAGPIVGIGITFTASVGSGSAQLIIQMLNNGTPVGRTRTVTVTSTSPFPYLLSLSAADLWGFQWTRAAVNQTNFGFQFVATNPTGSSVTVNVRGTPQIHVYTAEPVTVALAAGSLSPATGYKYVTAFGRADRGVVSTATAVSALIKPVAQGVTVTLPPNAFPSGLPTSPSPDTQVDQIWLFRTVDGGAIYYNVPGSPFPLGTATYLDNNPDSQLGKLQLADLQPQDGGQALNTPPTFGLVAPEVHLGRVWGAAGNTVFYSAGSDLGLIVGNGNESFPAANFFTFPSLVTRLLSVSTVDDAFLLVFTISDVYAIFGNASAIGLSTGVSGLTQFYPVPFLKRTGLLHYQALDVRGTQIYMFTADKRLIRFNPSSQVVYLDPEKAVEEIGFPIGAAPSGVTLTGGTLDSFDPSSTFVSWHGAGSGDQALYVADGSTGWFRCNTNLQPDGGISWSAKRNITGGCGPVQSIETSPGVFKLLIGTSNLILYRDTTSFTDNGSAYSAFGRFGGYVLAMPGQDGNVPFVTLDMVNTGSDPTLGILLGEIDGSFLSLTKSDNDPPHSAASASIKANRYYTRQATSGTQPSNTGRYLQLKVDFGNTDTVQNELLGLAIFGGVDAEY